MSKLNPSTRLKVKRDTFFLPDPKGGVYFRNNLSSFRMEGKTIYQWIEKLVPMFDGERTLGEITTGLTPPYRNRVYEIGEMLYNNGFVRDASQDTPHQLSHSVIEKYASQIEFIENFSEESGAYRFQTYRQAKVLAIGSDPMLVSLVSALIETGLPKLHVMFTDSGPESRSRLHEWIQHARQTDPDVELVELDVAKEASKSFWKEAVQPYDWILYGSQSGHVDEVRHLNFVCKEERKSFIPAICLQHVGLAGPLFHPESEGCWESAWRRIHRSALHREEPQFQSFSATTGSILANVAVFELFKRVTGIADSNQSNQIYMLDLETLEGDWHSFITHPAVSSRSFTPKRVEDLDLRLEKKTARDQPPSNLLEHFSRLTSDKIGIFHTWEERNLQQLPLAQCYVQAVNPMSEGPAGLLPEVVCAGLTHEEAKREAGLTGIEMYVSQMIDSLDVKTRDITSGSMSIGAGETIEEAVCRGLQVYLDRELKKRKSDQQHSIFHIDQASIKDKRCRFYFNALTTLNGIPAIGLKEDLLGFPVAAVRSKGQLYCSAGLNQTLAIQKALQQALLETKSEGSSIKGKKKESVVFLKKTETKLEISSCDEWSQLQLLLSAIETLRQKGKQLIVYDLTFDPFLKQEMAGVFGVQVRGGGS